MTAPFTQGSLGRYRASAKDLTKERFPMNDYEIGLEMHKKATEFVNKRFPSGWGGCAVIFTEDQQYLISVALESFNAGAGLCMETGAMCEAQKVNLRITHSLCVSRKRKLPPGFYIFSSIMESVFSSSSTSWVFRAASIRLINSSLSIRRSSPLVDRVFR